jgi:hypothetical protein
MDMLRPLDFSLERATVGCERPRFEDGISLGRDLERPLPPPPTLTLHRSYELRRDSSLLLVAAVVRVRAVDPPPLVGWEKGLIDDMSMMGWDRDMLLECLMGSGYMVLFAS